MLATSPVRGRPLPFASQRTGEGAYATRWATAPADNQPQHGRGGPRVGAQTGFGRVGGGVSWPKGGGGIPIQAGLYTDIPRPTFFACGHANGLSRLDPPQTPQLLGCWESRAPPFRTGSREGARVDPGRKTGPRARVETSGDPRLPPRPCGVALYRSHLSALGRGPTLPKPPLPTGPKAYVGRPVFYSPPPPENGISMPVLNSGGERRAGPGGRPRGLARPQRQSTALARGAARDVPEAPPTAP